MYSLAPAFTVFVDICIAPFDSHSISICWLVVCASIHDDIVAYTNRSLWPLSTRTTFTRYHMFWSYIPFSCDYCRETCTVTHSHQTFALSWFGATNSLVNFPPIRAYALRFGFTEASRVNWERVEARWLNVLVCVFGCADPFFFTMEFCAIQRIDTRKQQKSTWRISAKRNRFDASNCIMHSHTPNKKIDTALHVSVCGFFSSFSFLFVCG